MTTNPTPNAIPNIPQGQVVGKRYILQAELGKGGMGAVYSAYDRLTGQSVALKRVLVPASQLRFASFFDYSANNQVEELILALAQEFRVMSSLRHPNINSVLDYGFDAQRQPYYTMELLPNARSIFRATWGQPERIKVAAIVQLLQAMAYLHRRGVLHRDLKPANALVSSGSVRVLDFGLSLTLDEVSPSPQSVAGTVGYIAPEVLNGLPPSPLSDLFAVGVIAFEILTGQSLYSANDTSTIINETVNVPPDLTKIPNRAIAKAVAGLLEKNPEVRFQDAESAIAAFCEALDLPVPKETTAIRESFLQAARFVGRTTEYNDLLGLLRNAVGGKGSTRLIGGESGVGKTRLLEELRTQAMIQGMLVLRGQNADQGGAPYQVWRTPLRFLTLTTDLTTEEATVLKALVPDIGTLLGREIPDSTEVSPLVAQGRILALIERIFQRQQQPILLILEDMQWAGNESLNVLRRLAQIAPTNKLLILASYRDDERPDLPKDFPNVPNIKLLRLNEDGIEELSVAILSEAGRQPALLEFLKRETEGNVFFLIEIIRSLAEQVGRLKSVSGMALPEHVLTGGVAQVIRTRLSRVPEYGRALLQVAAVAGRYLDLKLLAAIAGSEFDMQTWLSDCTNVAVFDVQDDIFRFAHDKLREAVLSTLTDDSRKDLNRKIANFIESQYMLQINDHTGTAQLAQLVHHWAEAGNPFKHAQWASVSGKQALSIGAYQKAVEDLSIALEYAIDANETSGEKKQAAIHQQLGEAYVGLGRYEKAQQEFNNSLRLCQMVNYKWGVAQAQHDLGNVAIQLGEDTAARQYFLQSLASATSIRAQAIALPALIGIAGLLVKTAPEQAVELLSLALNNPSTDTRSRERAELMLAGLRETLFPAQIEAAIQRGAELRLSEVAKILLEG